MVLLIIIPMKNGYFIGNIHPTFSGPNLCIRRDKSLQVLIWMQSKEIFIFFGWHDGIGRSGKSVMKSIKLPSPVPSLFRMVLLLVQYGALQWFKKKKTLIASP